MAVAMGTAILMKVGGREGSGEWKNDGDGGFYDDYGGLYAKQTGKCRIFSPPCCSGYLDLRGCSCIQILMRNEAGGGHLVLCGTWIARVRQFGSY